MRSALKIKISILAAALLLTGCATTNPKDPFEDFNRAMFTFNDTVDQAAIKPAAEVYSTLLPQFVQIGINNFFGNLGDVWTGVNNFLQGKIADGLSDVMRVAVNTTMGFGGVLDIGSEAGLVKHKEDFGQTLGKWGVASGPYLVLPILGSSTVRDTFATPLDFKGDPWHYKAPVHVRNVGSTIRVIDLRSSVLDASNLVEEAALDRYVFIRDAYMQRRQSKVFDGEVPSSTYEHDVGPTAAEDLPAINDKGAAMPEPAEKPVVKLEQNDTVATTLVTEAKQ
ncbi:VacJ family lipoprotein [Noviherbaspirillum saxi]|uniref:VacJ family lipoprotein n=1 Tax=Noviherbaspirillum saxi TaxID=2320863 RepID=A0A3A3FWH5_9BURK|nr:VacJ family lipoprotein [Noviherbaspirillum saxi]RJF99674.1 VacJ family lipoprotein [Noviherbaspirillum saxi]